MAGKFEVCRDAAGLYRFRLKASNGQVVAQGQPYPTAEGARRGSEAVQRAAAGAQIEQVDAEVSSSGPGRSSGSGGSSGSGSGHSPGGSGSSPGEPHPGVDHVVIVVQENHTTDQLLQWAGAVGSQRRDRPSEPNPPTRDQPHDRHAYYQWLTSHQATRAVFDTLADLPFYAYLALTGAFLENHCSGFGTNSSPNHLMIVGGQSPTMRNPPRTNPPLWDLPSLPGAAEDAGLTWRCYCPYGGYPVSFYTQLNGSPNVVTGPVRHRCRG